MNAQDHPEYPREQDHLRRTLAAMERLLESTAPSVEPFITQGLVRHFRPRRERLEQAFASPYFGRADFAPNAAHQPETYYVGKASFSHDGQTVIAWQDQAARLFYEAAPGEIGYDGPAGEVKGLVLLKRNLDIEYQTLVTIADEFDLRLLPSDRSLAVVGDSMEYLRDVLASKQDARLRDIVATIQAQQYRLIRAEASQALVIQGGAGSGKTSVALHRLAFLLYPGNTNDLEAGRCIIFGPNQVFLNYISMVLPELGVENITQTTIPEWACEQMGLASQPLADTVTDAILSPAATREQKVMRYRRSQLKNSQRMGLLLERYVERRRQAFFPADGLTYGEVGALGLTVSLTNARITAAHSQSTEIPLNQHRERFLETLTTRLAEQYNHAVAQRVKELIGPAEKLARRARGLREEADRLEQFAAIARATGDTGLEHHKTAALLDQGASGLREFADYYQQQCEPIARQVERQRDEALNAAARQQALHHLMKRLAADVDRCWPPLDVVADYYSLLADHNLLAEIGQGLFAPEEVELLHQLQTSAGNAIDLSDLSAIHFLHMSVNGPPAALYDHIVIDEAQDVSRLQFETIRRFSRTGSLTILGDLPQSLYAHRGISNWDEIRAALPEFNYGYEELRKSYRTNYEIVTFANAVLQSMALKGQSITLAEPFERHGDPPRTHPLKSEAELPSAVASVVRQVQRERYRNIAVIAKTADHCSRLAESLRKARFDEFQLVLSADYAYEGGLVLLPVHLAKGMEFEAVLVTGADDTTYTATAFDGRLLYVALTRALHVLHIFWVGNVAWHLEQVIGRLNAAPPAQSAGQRQ